MNAAEYEEAAKEILDFICNYKEYAEDRPIQVPFLESENLFRRLPKDVPQNGESFTEVFNDFKKVILPRLVHWNHPLNFGPFPSPNSYPTILADLIVAIIGGVGFSYKSCPALTEMEHLMCNWYLDFLGIDEILTSHTLRDRSIGVYQQTVSDALYTVLLTARYRALNILCDVKRHDIKVKAKRELYLCKMTVYAPADCHISISKMCGLEYIYFRAVPLNTETGEYNYAELRKAIEDDVKNGLYPLMVICQIGSFTKFAVDPIEKIQKTIVNLHTCWIHCDASFGGNAMALEEYAYMRRGLQHVDSFVVCPHKWLNVGIDATLLWLKGRAQCQQCFEIHPRYLAPDKDQAVDLRHFGIALSRRFRALKMWFTFSLYGTKMLKIKLRHHISLAKMFADKLKENDKFQVILNKFTFVNFKLKNENAERQLEFMNRINEGGRMLISHCYYDDFPLLRFTVTYEFTTEEHIEKATNILFQAADDFVKK